MLIYACSGTLQNQGSRTLCSLHAGFSPDVHVQHIGVKDGLRHRGTVPLLLLCMRILHTRMTHEGVKSSLAHVQTTCTHIQSKARTSLEFILLKRNKVSCERKEGDIEETTRNKESYGEDFYTMPHNSSFISCSF